MNRHAKLSSACSERRRSSTAACTDTSSAGGFVRDEQIRAQRERPGQANSLALPAGKLPRKPRRVGRREPHCVEQFSDPLPARGTVAGAVHAQRFGDAIADRAQWVERARRILEHGPDAPAQLPQSLAGQGSEVSAKHLDGPGRWFLQSGHRARERRLARTRLPHEPDDLATADAHGHLVRRTEPG